MRAGWVAVIFASMTGFAAKIVRGHRLQTSLLGIRSQLGLPFWRSFGSFQVVTAGGDHAFGVHIFFWGLMVGLLTRS
jgi:hypothetical protein